MSGDGDAGNEEPYRLPDRPARSLRCCRLGTCPLPPEFPQLVQKATPALFNRVMFHSDFLGSMNKVLDSVSVERGCLVRQKPQLYKHQVMQLRNTEHATQQLDRDQR